MSESLYIVWEDANNLGIPILDEQHRSIVSTINSLDHFIREGKSESIVDAVLNTLEQHTFIHFATEEQLLLKSGYPDLNKHIRSHRRLSQEVSELLGARDGERRGEEVLQFLKAWWLDHIANEDRSFVPYIVGGHQERPQGFPSGVIWCRQSWQV